LCTEWTAIQDEFPDFHVSHEMGRGYMRYISRSRRLGVNPHTVITDDLDELCEVLRKAQYPRDTAQPSAVNGEATAGNATVGQVMY
jgi:hypothetical protein